MKYLTVLSFAEQERRAFIEGLPNVDAFQRAADSEGAEEAASDAVTEIEDAMASQTDPRILDATLGDLRGLLKHVRGENRDELERIIAALDDADTEMRQDMDIVTDKLRQAIKHLRGTT